MAKTKTTQSTVTISVTPQVLERMEYIALGLGLKSRSAAICMAVNDMYSELKRQAKEDRA